MGTLLPTPPGRWPTAPNTLTGDVIIDAGVTLTVEPGVVVKGNENVELKVLGHLQALGTASLPITFTSAINSGPSQWSGLVFDGGTGDLRHVTVRYGGDQNSVLPWVYHNYQGSNIVVRNVLAGKVRIQSSRVVTEYATTSSSSDYQDYGLYVANSHVTVSDTLFANNGGSANDYALYATGASVVTLTTSTFQDNPGHGLRATAGSIISLTTNTFQNTSGSALYASGGSTVTLRGVTVADNTGDGIYVAGGSASAVTVTHSAIHGNGGMGVRNDSGVEVDARNNWWGDMMGPGGEGPGAGDEVSANVAYYPWLPVPNLAVDVVAGSHDAGDLVTWRDLSWPLTGAVTVTVWAGNTPVPDEHWFYWSTYTDSPADLSALPPSRFLEWFILSTNVPGPESVAVAHDVLTYTTVSGFISGDTTWRAANSPFLATSSIWVNEGTRLNIEPGVTVWMSDTRSLQIDGALIALGTASQPITFTSWHAQGQKDDWGLIAFNATAEDALFDGSGNYLRGSALQHVTVEYAGVEYEHATMGRFSYAVDASQTALYVDHCTIRHNGSGGLRSLGGYVTHNTVSNNSLSGSAAASGAGIYSSGGGTLANNTVSGNTCSCSNSSCNARGGGIYSAGGGTVAENTVTGNSCSASPSDAYCYGGGIYSTGDGMVSNNTVTGNQAYGGNTSHGGGIYGKDSTVLHNTVMTNVSRSRYYAYGGGIYGTGACTVSNNIVAANAVYYSDSSSSNQARGGGIYSVSGGSVESNEVRANSVSGANAYGGGMYISDGSARNNTVISNTAQGNAGGVYWVSTVGEMLYNTIVSNTTSGTAGGIYILTGYPTIHHNAFVGNSGYDLYNNNPLSNVRLDARYNWWGVTADVAVQGAIYDWFDDTSLGLVDYGPFLLDHPTLRPSGINLSGQTDGLVNTTYSFDASVYPIAAITPITYVWQVVSVETGAGQAPITHTADSLYDTASFTWQVTGTKRITVTASNREGAAVVTHTILIASVSSNDAYEVDDTCAQTHTIATNGTTQLHTFHSASDTDWATFQAIAGTTYVVEATTSGDSGADIRLEIYDTCDGTPGQSQDNSFSPDVSLTFDAPTDGPLYLRLTDAGGAAGGQGTAYYLSVRALSQAPDPGILVLVAGKRTVNDPLQPNIYNVTNAVYRLFLANGYTGDRIYYLAPDTSLDADADGLPDVDRISSEFNLEQAITQWAVDKVDADHPLTLYVMDHGDYDLFHLNLLTGGPETVTPHELNDWLNQLEAAAPGVKVNVIAEACKSGSFIDLAQTVSKAGRVVIGSTGAYPVAYASATGAAFSDAFIAALGRGMSLNSSFAEAEWTLQQAHPDQTPWLDDNGNGVPNEVEDGQEAAQRGFAYAGTFSDLQWPPYILWAAVQQTEGVIKAQVQAADGKVVSSTWALIYSPSYEPPPPGEDMVRDEDDPNVDKIVLQDPDGDGIFTAPYSFVEPDTYRVVIYAVDDRGTSARPKEVREEPILSISKAGPSSVNAGEPITYTLTVINNGAVEVSNIVISDVIPVGAHYVGGGTKIGNVVSWTVSSLAADGGTVQVTFVVTATATIINADYRVSTDGGIRAIGNLAVVTTVSGEGEPVLTISKAAPSSANAGELITYTLTVINDGTATADNLVVTDVVPVGAHYIGGGTKIGNVVSWTVSSLTANGGTVEVTFVVTATATITNADYHVSADGGISAVGNLPVVTTVSEEGEPVLTISKAGPSSANAGELITYTLTVINDGTATADNLVITDALPVGANFIRAGAGTLLLPSEVVRWQIPSLSGDGESTSVQFVVTATTTITNVDYRASADGDVSAIGSLMVVTTIDQDGNGNKIYLPLVLRQ